MEKKCGKCDKEKSLSEFFIAPSDGASSWHGTSMFCIECHNDGLIEYGYGWKGFGEKYKTPDWYATNNG